MFCASAPISPLTRTSERAAPAAVLVLRVRGPELPRRPGGRLRDSCRGASESAAIPPHLLVLRPEEVLLGQAWRWSLCPSQRPSGPGAAARGSPRRLSRPPRHTPRCGRGRGTRKTGLPPGARPQCCARPLASSRSRSHTRAHGQAKGPWGTQGVAIYLPHTWGLRLAHFHMHHSHNPAGHTQITEQTHKDWNKYNQKLY